MVKNITRRLSLTTTSAIALAMILVGQVAALAVPCSKPSQDTPYCVQFPDDSVADCNYINPHNSSADCATGKVYAINRFPITSVDSATGVITQVQVDCKQSRPCRYDPDINLCKPDGANNSAWSQAAKTVNDNTKTCPTAG